MLAFQAGEDDAFTHLVEHYQGAAFAMLRRLLGPHPSIEDLAQEAFLRVWRGRDRYEAKGKFTTYLYRITYNLALNRLRDDKRKPLPRMPRDEDGIEMETPDLGSKSPEESADVPYWDGLVKGALAELPENQRAAVVLQHYDGLELHEIGEILGISPQATKSLLHRARGNLRTLLNPFREAEHD